MDNLLETADGGYHLVDLESGLVSPLASPRTWARALRRGLVPMFDDVFFDVTRAYVAREETAMRAALGDAQFGELVALLDAAEAETVVWHRSEPRLWGRLVRGVWSGLGLRTWQSRTAAKFAGSQERARAWMSRAVATWEGEGRVTAAEAEAMRAHMDGAEFQAMMPHLGAHIVISIILRFPLGSIVRAAWTVGALVTATGRLLARRIDRRAWTQAWRIHSPLVIVLSAVPGFGTFAYLAAKPVRSNRLLLRATSDAMLTKAPWQVYERTGLRRLVARPAGAAGPAPAPREAGRPDTGRLLVPEPGFVAALTATVAVEEHAAPRPPHGLRRRGGSASVPEERAA